MDNKVLFTGKDEIIDKPVGLNDIKCTLHKNDDKYYIVGNMTDKEEILKRLYTDTLDFIAKTQGINQVEDYITFKGTGLHLNEFTGTDMKKPNIYATDYIDTYKDGEKAEKQKETEDEMFREYLAYKLDDASGLKSSVPDLFDDKREELAYIWTFKDFDDDIPRDFTQSEVIDLVNFIRDYENKSDELCEKAIQSIIDDNKGICEFYGFLNSYEPEYLIRLFYEDKVRLDYPSLLEDTQKIYNPADAKILPKGNQFIYVLDDNEVMAYEFLNEKSKNVSQEWEIRATISYDPFSHKNYSEETIRERIESQCEIDNIHIRQLTIHTPKDTYPNCHYLIDLKADNMVTFFSDPSVGIEGEFEGMWEDDSDIKQWLKYAVRLDGDYCDLGTTYSAEDYDTLYEKYQKLEEKRLAPMIEAEEKYLQELNENTERDER